MCQSLKTKINVIKIIETVFPCFLFHNDLLRDFVCHIILLIQKFKKRQWRWEKSVRALMINQDIFLTVLSG